MLGHARIVNTFFVCLSMLQHTVQSNEECDAKRIQATRLSTRCCSLTRPTLDKASQECALETLKKVPAGKKLTFNERLSINICIEECNFISNGYIDVDPPYVVDMKNVGENIAKYTPAESQFESMKFLVAAYRKCEKFLKDYPSKLDIKYTDVDFIDEYCNPFALRITTCVRIFAMQDCPEKLYKQTDECKWAHDFFKLCVASIKDTI